MAVLLVRNMKASSSSLIYFKSALNKFSLSVRRSSLAVNISIIPRNSKEMVNASQILVLCDEADDGKGGPTGVLIVDSGKSGMFTVR